MEHRWNEIDRRKTEVLREKPIPLPLCPTNPIWTDPGSNLGLRGGRLSTNRLSHDTAGIAIALKFPNNVCI